MAVLYLILGPILLGTFLNVLLSGVLLAQVTWYFTVHKQDKRWLKWMVIWLLLLDTLNSIFDVGFAYRYTITLFGDFAALGRSHWFFHVGEIQGVRSWVRALLNSQLPGRSAGPFMTATIAATTQCFFAWRVTKLTGHAWIGWSIAAAAFVQILAGVGTSVGSWIVVDFDRFGELNAPMIVWLALSAITDVHSHRTGFPHTDDVLTKLIRSTVQTGLLTSFWAVINLILFLVVSNNLHLLFNLPLSKLYTNSLMSTLNSRSGWDSGMNVSPAPAGIINGVSVHISTIHERDKQIGRNNTQPRTPNEPTSTLARQITSDADDSFELHEYAKLRKVDLEGGDKAGSLSPTRTSGVTGVDQNDAKGVEIAQLELAPRGMRAGTSDEWSVSAPSDAGDMK